MGVAIITKYLSPTNRTGSRIKATTGDNSPETGRPDHFTGTYKHELSPVANHARVAKELAKELGWEGLWIAGGMGDKGTVWVRMPLGTAAALATLQGSTMVEGQDCFWVEPKQGGR